MRKALIISALIGGLVVVVAGALLFYAAMNLQALVARNQAAILNRVSAALGRRVTIQSVKARARLGIYLEMSGVQIADDPAFSSLPFATANQVSLEVRFLPLLYGRAELTHLHFIEPAIRIVRNQGGQLNLSTLGAPAANSPSVQSAPQKGGSNAEATAENSDFAGLSIDALSIEDGTIYYAASKSTAPPATLYHVDLDLTGFSVIKPFQVDLRGALFDPDQQNFHLAGQAGPLFQHGMLELEDLPMELKSTLGPIELQQFNSVPVLGAALPAGLTASQPFTLNGTFKGTPLNSDFELSLDASQARVAYAGLFDKPAGITMVLAVQGQLSPAKPSELKFTQGGGSLKLANLVLKTNQLSVSAHQVKARFETNKFSLGQVGPIFTAIAIDNLSGTGELRGELEYRGEQPDINAVLMLTDAGAWAAHGLPAISHLDGSLTLAHGHAAIQSATFALGSARVTASGLAKTLSPLDASYQFHADTLKLDELFPRPRASDTVRQLAITGSASGTLEAPILHASIKSGSGNLARIDYRDLDLNAAWDGQQLSATPLRAAIFDGTVAADLNVLVNRGPAFDLALTMRHLDLDQLQYNQEVSSNRLSGLLTGTLKVAGAGRDWKHIQPTLRGRGRLAIADGKLKGINIVAIAINKIAAAPGVSQLVNAAFLSSHQRLLADPDTELQQASMTFGLAGTRITGQDLTVRSPDYGILGDGWFDLDRNISMTADVQLSFGLTIALPIFITGQFPLVLILPNVPKLAERVALGALQAPGKIIRGGVSTLGGVIGSVIPGGAGRTPLSEPLNRLKNLFP